jgi:hypothetical protein
VWLFTIRTLLFSVGMIGFFEGGYNHLVKNVLFLVVAKKLRSSDFAQRPLTKCLDNVGFEMTGVLQFFPGLWAAYYGFRLWRESRDHERAT